MLQVGATTAFINILAPTAAFAADAAPAVEEAPPVPPTGIIKVTTLPKYKPFVWDDFVHDFGKYAFRFSDPSSIPEKQAVKGVVPIMKDATMSYPQIFFAISVISLVGFVGFTFLKKLFPDSYLEESAKKSPYPDGKTKNGDWETSPLNLLWKGKILTSSST